MRSLPRSLQSPLTVFTGKPLAGQAPFGWSPTYHLAAAVASMIVGAVIVSAGRDAELTAPAR
ncbi:hypothetical protein [Streptomyces tubercidicus]|uniref:hypothetical protein n=1 Tax=Streptomyces tubercidicus TaxID=47759 RepID=UPI0034673A53